MARMRTLSVRCKNKLCDYHGTQWIYGESVNMVCPTCGFKSLEQYYPEYERIFADIRSKKLHNSP